MRSELFVIVFHLFAFILLMQGLFPFSSSTNQISTRSCFNSPKSTNRRVIIILIDALRSDYIFNRNHSFYLRSISKLEEEKKALSIKLRTHTPTVTLPRLKAILTGTIPSFWDVLFNYNSSSLEIDNLLFQYKKKYPEKKIVFYGDDTWLKLFPYEIFSRSYGLQSFFVSDFKEIDINVTHGLYVELNQIEQWDLLIVHYLGLDHIGHAYGAFNSFVQDKLLEMDEMIEYVYSKVNLNDVILITGDHGMIDQGGHGGSSNEEIFVPAVFISKGFQEIYRDKNEYFQIDLTPTLSALLEIAIPFNNLGILIENVLKTFQFVNKTNLFQCLIDDNRRQLVNLLSNTKLSTAFNDLQQIRQQAMKLANEQDIFMLILSIFIFFLSTILLWFHISKMCLISIVISILFYVISNRIFVSLSIGIITFCFIGLKQGQRRLINYKFEEKMNLSNQLLIYYPIFHCLSLFSSSFIEEEHQTWYYLLSTYLFLRTFEEKSFQYFIFFLFSRLIRSWNQTGNKWLNLSDIGDFLNNSFSSLSPLFYYGLLIYFLIWKEMSITNILFCLLYLICRTHNCVIIVIYMIFYEYLLVTDGSLAFLLSQSAFFHLGNSNSFVTIDISTGFVGIPIYIPIIHGFFIYLSTYGLSILWLMKLSREQRTIYLLQLTLINTLFSICVFLQRYHLFVWTVFAPKLFYQSAQTAFNFILFL
ncbi:unnamed protein product [Adineta ricciae]|uniref:GPI ethanolamine phosphate transferase 2 C-terminal domain-containing protein n=1 Tax=Adineta ricciae TaxID=249248 RepID=A0A815EJD2_ADIRI|nr:unnamed protein product [Adineta ricciae]